jgi:hypothetical protein
MRPAALAILVVMLVHVGDAQVVRYIDGVFVAPRDGGAPIELIAYAEAFTNGVLAMQHGTLEDAPLVHEVARVMISVPNWRPTAMFVATSTLFRDERAERRTLSFAARRLNVYAVELRIVDLERREKIESLLKSVRASADAPGYAFVVIASDTHVKYFPIRLTPFER